MKQLLTRLEQAIAMGEDLVLVTVIASSGSTPRGAGARMLVSRGGLLAGTIGGGAVEHRCIEAAVELLDRPHRMSMKFELNKDDTAGLGMVCGGLVQVSFFPVAAGDQDTIRLCREAAERFCAGEAFWLVTPLQEGEPLRLWPERGERALTEAGADAPPAEPAVRRAGNQAWFWEQLQGPGRVYIFGGGHVAQALVPVLLPLGFACTVLEDREEFAQKELFPQACDVRRIDFRRVLEEVVFTQADYICIMTRGHENDLLVQSQVLRTPARYIGVIGSRKKTAACFAALREQGFTDGDLARVVTPIGVPVGGNAPAEIAISIAAQLLRYRSGLEGGPKK